MIAFYAALVSTGVGVVQVLDFAQSERRHLSVWLTPIVGETAGQGEIEVRVVNDGNRRVTVHDVGLQPRGAALGDSYGRLGSLARPKLPKALDEGEELPFSIDANRVVDAGDSAAWLVVVTAENARYRGSLANALFELEEREVIEELRRSKGGGKSRAAP